MLRKIILILCLVLLLASCASYSGNKDGFESVDSTESITQEETNNDDYIQTEGVTETQTEDKTETEHSYSNNVPVVVEKDDYKFIAIQLKGKYDPSELYKPFILKSIGDIEKVLADNQEYNNTHNDISSVKRRLMDETDPKSFFECNFIVGFYVGAKYISNPISVSDDVKFRPYVNKISVNDGTITFDISKAFEKPDAEYLMFVALPRTYYVSEYVVNHSFNEHPAPFVEINGYNTNLAVRLYNQEDGHVNQFSYAFRKCDNRDDVKVFLDDNRLGCSWREEGYDKTAEEICQKYDEKFFEDNTLLIVTGSVYNDQKISVSSIINNGFYTIININFGKDLAERISTHVVKESCLFIEIPKDTYNLYFNGEIMLSLN